MHAIEKILASHCGRDSVKTGEIVTAKVDFAEINDLYLQTVYSFREMGAEKVWDKDKAAFVFDHYSPCPTIKTAANHSEMREFAKEQGLTHHFDTNAGVCHQVMPEAGLIYPGMIVIATDSHTTTHGAFGALGTGVGATDMACILATGEMWFRVPEIVEIRLDGKAAPGVFPKDVVLNVLGKVKADGCVYKAIEFTGSYIEDLDVPGRMTICNMAVEMGAKTAYMQPNDKVLEYVRARSDKEFQAVSSDPDFVFSDTYTFNVSEMVPAVSCPHSVDNVHELREIAKENIAVNQGYIGSCTNGRLEDLEIAAKVLKGRKIAPFTRLIIVPASSEIMQKAMLNGTIKTLMDAGATITTPGCAACLGTHEGILGPGEVCITSTNRNFRGRMGSPEAFLYLGSPATVAASLIEGRIADPTPYLKEEN